MHIPGEVCVCGLHVPVKRKKKKVEDKHCDICREAQGLLYRQGGRGIGGINTGAAQVQVVLAANMMFRHDLA